MAIFMITVAVLAYALLWYLIVKCNNIIKQTGDEGNSSRDILNNENN